MFLDLLSIWQQINHWDQWLFTKVNSGLSNPFFDWLMPILRTGKNWAPLYLFLAVFALLNFRWKGLWWVILFVVTVALTDMTGTYIFKHNFERLRPCNDPEFFMHVRVLLKYCSGGFSFISNHAANHFGLATFFYFTMKPVLKNWAKIAFVWAGLIAFSQVYVGVHYPLDVTAGAIWGLILGSFTGLLFNKQFGFSTFDDQPTFTS